MATSQEYAPPGLYVQITSEDTSLPSTTIGVVPPRTASNAV